MARPVSRRGAIASLGATLALASTSRGALASPASPAEDAFNDNRAVLHLEPWAMAHDAPVELFCLGQSSRDIAHAFEATQERMGNWRRTKKRLDNGSASVFISEIWSARDYYRVVPESYFEAEIGDSAGTTDAGFRLHSELIQGAAVGRIDNPSIAYADPHLQAKFNRLLSNGHEDSAPRTCVIAGNFAGVDQIRACPWTARLCRERASTLISVVPRLAPPLPTPHPWNEERSRAETAINLLRELSDLTIVTCRSHFGGREMRLDEDAGFTIGEIASFVADLVSTRRFGLGEDGFRQINEGRRFGYAHQFFAAHSMPENDTQTAVMESVAETRRDERAGRTIFQIQFAPFSRRHEVKALALRLCDLIGMWRPPFPAPIRLIPGEEKSATIVQWLNSSRREMSAAPA